MGFKLLSLLNAANSEKNIKVPLHGSVKSRASSTDVYTTPRPVFIIDSYFKIVLSNVLKR